MQVPFHRPSIEQEEIDEVVDTLRSGWLTTGPKTAKFEQEFRNYLSVPQAQAVNSCTAGLDLEIDEVVDTLRSGWLTTGPKTAKFEQEFRNYLSVPQAQAVNSCTAGLHL